VRSFVAAAAALVLLTACAPTLAPPGPGPAQPALTQSAFVTADGLELPVRRWLPDDEPIGVVLAVHGFNDYSKSFGKVPGAPGVGPVLSDQGFAVIAYDQRGFGRAPHTGLWAGDDVLAQDFIDFARTVKATYPDIPLYAIGVSMGGAVVIAGLTSDSVKGGPPPLDAVVLVAPAVWARETMPLPYRAALWAGAHTVPWAKPSGRGLGRRASDNNEMLRDNGADPLFIKDTRIDSIYGLTNLMDRALDKVSELPVPALYLYGANDQIIPKTATQRAVDRFLDGTLDRRFAFYEDGWHMMLRDRQASVVIGDVRGFFRDPNAPLPSGAEKGAVKRFVAAAE
jgi:acylglycerol lipase